MNSPLTADATLAAGPMSVAGTAIVIILAVGAWTFLLLALLRRRR